MSIADRIGFMQGRLSPIFGGRIQVFPWTCWRDEFPAAHRLSLNLMEWTLDMDRLYDNPLMVAAGQSEIRQLVREHGVGIPSLTGDCFMQAPFWKTSGAERQALQHDFLAVADACSKVGISMIVVPLVDNGRLENAKQEDTLVSYLQAQTKFLANRGLRVIFECDFPPLDLARFIGRLDAGLFGVNYDIGNSASLGFNPMEEFTAYGERIINVHVKDRVPGGTTVPLGAGGADFKTVFELLGRMGYCGNYILQTARATDGDHAGVLAQYRDMVMDWTNCNAA